VNGATTHNRDRALGGSVECNHAARIKRLVDEIDVKGLVTALYVG